MKKTKRIISAALAVLMLAMSALLCGCGASGVELKEGFIYDGGEVLACLCAYQSDYNEFDIFSVSVYFSYGPWYVSDSEEMGPRSMSVPKFKLYFSNTEGDRYLVKTVREQLISKKYACFLPSYKPGEAREAKFNHSEKLTIPAYLFKGKEGMIRFSIRGVNENNQVSKEEKVLGVADIMYEVEGTRVKLYTYSQWFDKEYGQQ